MAEKKAEDPSALVVFVYTIGLTSGNGQNKVNNDFVQAFVDELTRYDLLNNKDVKVLHTSTFHASPKDAHHEDNIAGNKKFSICLSTPLPHCLPLMFLPL